ncbi:MAG TPA: VOC family protein [Candidatus Binatia bacterium]|nr:VOC family protein [Candidatus Binatia bacterium]
MSHPIVHVEISAQDRAKLADFYSEIFGWQFQDYPDMNYTTFTSGEGGVGGGYNPVQEDNPAGTIVVYIAVDDVQGTLDKIEECGGKTLVPPTEIPGVGTIAQFHDPTGNRMAIIKGDENAMQEG